MVQLRIENLLPDFDEFVKTSFDRHPTLHRGAMTDRLHLLPNSSTLDSLLTLDVLPPDSVRLTRAGKGLAKSAYTRPTGELRASTVVDQVKVMQLFKSGATLTINDLHSVWPTAMLMVRLLSQSFACKSGATVFATPAGRAGFPAHTDELGVIVVQSEGTKDWRVWPTELNSARASTTYEDETILGPPLLEVTLEPGDVLYLPHRTPHAAAATYEQSIHISLDLRPRGWHDIISGIVAEKLKERESAEFPALTEANLPTLISHVKLQLDALRESLNDLDTEKALKELRSNLVNELVKATPPGLEDMRRVDKCSSEQLFRVSKDAIEVLEEDAAEGRSKVRVDGITMMLPKVIVATLTDTASTPRKLTCHQVYPDVPVGRAMSVSRQLTRMGALSLLSPDTN